MTNKAFELQREVKVNAEEYQNYLKELYRWEDEIKKKDESLKAAQCKQPTGYPIRNKNASTLTEETINPPIKEDSVKEGLTESQKKQKAVLEKEKGNQFFKELKYDRAVTCYSSAIDLNPGDAILYANRAMAYLKMNKFKEADKDCCKSIEIDPTYVKAYHRRGVAKLSLGMNEEALKDFQEVLRQEPHNKAARQELDKLHSITSKTGDNKRLVEEKKEETSVSRKAKIVEINEEPEYSDRKVEALKLNHPSFSTIKSYPKLPSSTINEPRHNLKILKVNDSQHEKRIIEKIIDQVDEKNQNNELPARTDTASNTSVSYVLPPVPRNYAQFNQQWVKLRGNNELLFSYLKKITPIKLPEIFRESLEPDVLGDIIKLLKTEVPTRNEPILPWLQALSNVKRIRAVILFLPSDLKSDLADLAKSLSSSSGVTEENLKIIFDSLGL